MPSISGMWTSRNRLLHAPLRWTSASLALVHLSGGKYDGLFLDVHMPEIEGMAAPSAMPSISGMWTSRKRPSYLPPLRRTSAKEALVHLSGGKYDGLFLDVHMPEIEGMALARLLRRFADPPGVVFLTGHPDAAVEAFEVQALDFIVKPVGRDRLEAALDRVEQHAFSKEAPSGAGADAPASSSGPDVVAVDNPGRRQAARAAREHPVAQANGDYARIHAPEGRFLLRTPLSQLEKDWAGSGFARVHRAYLVNLGHAVELRALSNGTAVLVMRDGEEIPVARRNVAALRRRLNA